MKKRISLIWILALGVAPMALATEGIWAKKADMPTARYFLGTCVVDGKIYAIGGAPQPHVSLSVVEVYDPPTDTWTRKASMPAAKAGLGTSVVNGKIYAIGGGGGARSTYEYDPATDTWARKADIPTARDFLTTSVVNGKIYAIGGATSTSGPAFRTVEEYDPATNTWARKADLPAPRYLHAASVVDGKIYIIAGSWQAWTASPAVYEYDPATDTWERKADAPTVGSWLSASAVDGRIYVIGIGEDVFPKGVEEYDPATDTWTTRRDMPTARAALSTCELNGKIYAVGGTATTAYNGLATVEEYYPNPLVIDFNGDGNVDIQDLLKLVESWGTDDPIVDIAPRPSGDGVVDALDLELLMSYWGQPVEDPTLIAHWALDEAKGEIAYDSAGQNDALLIGGPVWQPEGGMIDGALQLDGIDDYVNTPFVLNPADGKFTIFVWIKGGTAGQAVLSQAGGANWLCTDSVEGCLVTELKAAGRGGAPLSSQIVITDGQWYRIGLVWDGSNRILYVDGVAVAEDTQDNLEGSDDGLYIGTSKNMEGGTFWSGLIDDVRIYNRAVSP